MFVYKHTETIEKVTFWEILSKLLFKIYKFYGQITWEFLGLRMQNFQGITFIQIKIDREIFKSALVYLWMVYQVIDNVKVFRAYQNNNFMC